MMSGVAQVMARKPTCSSFFSGTTLSSAAIAARSPIGSSDVSASSTAPAPTAARTWRRVRAEGKRPWSNACSTPCAIAASGVPGPAACAPPWPRPHEQKSKPMRDAVTDHDYTASLLKSKRGGS